MLAKAFLLGLLMLASQQDACQGQLSFHNDAHTNSFTLKTPGLQHTYTRYYGAAAKQQQQQQQPQTAGQQEQAQSQVETQPQVQTQDQQLQQLQNPTQFSSFSPAGVQYQSVYPQQQQQQSALYESAGASASTRGGAKPIKSAFVPSLQQQQQQLQQQLLLAHQQQQQQQAGAGVGAGAIPSYADQMQAAFLDYQRQRVEFEQQQQQLLQKLYHYYPDVSGSLASQSAATAAAAASGAASPTAATNRYVQRQSANPFGSNGLQQRHTPAAAATTHTPASFYSTQQHLGFMQQQQQDILRDQQQSVAQQFATSQLAPTTTQSFGMAVPMSSVLGTSSYQSSPEVSHVNFSSGNLNYSF